MNRNSLCRGSSDEDLNCNIIFFYLYLDASFTGEVESKKEFDIHWNLNETRIYLPLSFGFERLLLYGNILFQNNT